MFLRKMLRSLFGLMKCSLSLERSWLFLVCGAHPYDAPCSVTRFAGLEQDVDPVERDPGFVEREAEKR